MAKDLPSQPIPPRAALATKPMGIFESATAARANLLSIIPEIALKQPIVSGTTGTRWHMVMDPTALRRILKDRLDDYPKSDVTKRILRPAIGESIFIAEGADWRWQRRAAAPVFQVRNIDNLAPVFSAAADACADRLATQVGGTADVYAETVRMTIEVIANVTFSSGEALDPAVVGKGISQYIESVGKVSFLDIIGAPDWIPRPGRILRPRQLGYMQTIARDAISYRRNYGPKEVPDLLDLLMAGQDPETQRTMSPGELRDNVLAFITAGHETTALSLAWALYLIAFDQAVQDKARDEALAALKGAQTATAEHLDELVYLRQILEEALRLYPPAALLSRTAQKPDTICGREIRRGDTVMLPIYALHRHHLLWDNPDGFDPDRFAPGHQTDRYAYLPFGSGPRICIGAEFALRESLIILATLLARFRFDLPEDHSPPEPHLLMTLRPKGGITLRVDPV